ncbi:hypothetical protein PCE1_000893 [Barthelona sp. PCE]
MTNVHESAYRHDESINLTSFESSDNNNYYCVLTIECIAYFLLFHFVNVFPAYIYRYGILYPNFRVLYYFPVLISAFCMPYVVQLVRGFTSNGKVYALQKAFSAAFTFIILSFIPEPYIATLCSGTGMGVTLLVIPMCTTMFDEVYGQTITRAAYLNTFFSTIAMGLGMFVHFVWTIPTGGVLTYGNYTLTGCTVIILGFIALYQSTKKLKIASSINYGFPSRNPCFGCVQSWVKGARGVWRDAKWLSIQSLTSTIIEYFCLFFYSTIMTYSFSDLGPTASSFSGSIVFTPLYGTWIFVSIEQCIYNLNSLNMAASLMFLVPWLIICVSKTGQNDPFIISMLSQIFLMSPTRMKAYARQGQCSKTTNFEMGIRHSSAMDSITFIVLAAMVIAANTTVIIWVILVVSVLNLISANRARSTGEVFEKERDALVKYPVSNRYLTSMGR